MAQPMNKQEFDPFNRPIPGESLTDAPNSRPWDRPPRFTTPDEVLDMVTDKLEDPENMDTLMEAIMAGGSIETIVNTIGIEGVTRGEFTPDVAELVKPPLSLYLFDEALKRKIPVQFFDADMESRGKDEQMNRLQMMKDMRPEMFDAMSKEVMPPEEEMSMEEPMMEEPMMEEPMGPPPMMAEGGFIERRGYQEGGSVKDSRLKSAGVSGYNKPKRTPSHPTKSHVVVAKSGDKVKTIRFGQQGVSGSPEKEGESKAYRNRRKSFKARHAGNISKGNMSAAYWADKVKWKDGGLVTMKDPE